MWKIPPTFFMAGAAICLFAGCSSMTVTTADDATQQTYKDPASGVVFPVHVSALNRISMDTDGPQPVSAHYTAAQPLHMPDQNIGLMHTSISHFLDATVTLEPSAKGTPDQKLGQTVRECQAYPNFVQEDYRGQRTFGAVTAQCIQCAFDRPAWNDRATFKVVIVPRGPYLICFTFLVSATQEKDWQDVIDAFVQGILSQSTAPVIMAPED
jgi:hypothetical protein